MNHLIPSHQNRPADDPIFALNVEATNRRKKGESIVNATVGALCYDDGKLAILPTAARTVHEVPAEEWAAYAPIAGTPDFTRAVIDDVFSGHPVMRESAIAVATPGGSGALRLAIGNYLDRGQALLTTDLFWGPYRTLADESERAIATFSMFDETSKNKAPNDVGGFNVSAMDRALAETITKQDRALVFLNDPCHNPTGYSMTNEEWRDVTTCLADHAKRAPVTVLLDTAYSAYAATDPREHLSRFDSILDRVGLLLAWSASKTFTHYGLRVGAIVACVPDAKERTQTEAALSYSCRGTWSNCSRGGLRAITTLLTDRERAAAVNVERTELRKLLTSRVDAFNQAARAAGLRYPRYDGGFFVTVFHADPQRKAAAMRERGVFVVPQNGSLRVALCGVAESDIPRLVETLRD